MKISLDWVGDYLGLASTMDSRELARQLTLKTVEVEGCVDLADELRGVVVARVAEVEPTSSGALKVRCVVGPDRWVSVVTRAKNLAPGAAVAAALPGARVNGRTIEPVTVDGTPSEAYICRAADLGLTKLFPATGPGDALVLDDPEVDAGRALADAIPWRDRVLEIDNKSLTNRPDLWGHHGVARELAAIFELPLSGPMSLPGPASQVPDRPVLCSGLVGAVDAAVCRRLALVEFELDSFGPSPSWLRNRLASIGEASVNLPVDLGNYVMFATGQPVHVYDADRVALPLSAVAQQAPGDLTLLDGRTIEVPTGAAVICDAYRVVGLAGIMGGQSSCVTGGSRRFVLEAATFTPRVIRRAALHTGLRTEASARFEKGLDTQRVDQAVDLYLALLARCAPGARVLAMEDFDPNPTLQAEIEVQLGFLAKRIGMQLEPRRITAILEALGFVVRWDGTMLRVTAPTWRSTGDVSIPDDVLEEVARIHGYEEISAASLGGVFTHLEPTAVHPLDRRVREQLAQRFAMQEVLTYPWSADQMLEAAGYDPADGVRIDGAPAPDRASLRPSLVPNLLEAVVANLRFTSQFSIFEVGTVYDGTRMRPWADRFETTPALGLRAAAVLVGADGAELFLHAKGVLEDLTRTCQVVELQFNPPRPDTDDRFPKWADRQVRLHLSAGERRAGTLALLSSRCRRLAGIEGVQVACFELDLDALSVHATRENAYEPVPEWPESDFDLSVVVPEQTRWTEVSESARSAGRAVHRVDYVGEFRGSWVPEGAKSMTLRITLRPESATLTSEDIASMRDSVLSVLHRDLGAHLRA